MSRIPSDKEIETIYQVAPIGLCVFDTSLRWVRVNDRLAEINGFPAAAHIGKRMRDLLPSSFARESGLGRVFGSSTGYRLPSGDLVEPDIGFVLRSRLPPLEAGKFLELVPDTVVEVVSPSDPKRDFVEKRAVYEANGVREYWVVAPEKKTVLLLVLEGGRFRETLIDLEGSVMSSVLPGFRMTARDVFDGLP